MNLIFEWLDVSDKEVFLGLGAIAQKRQDPVPRIREIARGETSFEGPPLDGVSVVEALERFPVDRVRIGLVVLTSGALLLLMLSRLISHCCYGHRTSDFRRL